MAKLGIDFGTTNSVAVAYDRKSNQFTYFNYSGSMPVPTSSTIWYHDNTIEVGSNARNNINTYADVEGHCFVKSVKLMLGREQSLNIFGKATAPYKVAGEILSHIKSKAIGEYMADKAGVDMNRAVFTVPINFNGKARQDLRKSAHEAGIEVTTFIHEPFAAIVGYMFTKDSAESSKKVIQKIRQLGTQHILTFDWGGGTLDITVVKLEHGKMYELGTAELTNVAGDKFDEDIAWYAWNKHLDEYGYKYSDEYLEEVRKQKWDRMLAVAEQCKIELSSSNTAEFLVENLTARREDLDVELTRKEFEKLIDTSLIAATNRIDEALRDAGVKEIDIQQVLLTGGTCNIPAVQSRIVEKFGHRVKTVKNADLVIAQGAAVISEMGWLPFLTRDIQIELSDGSFWPIFEHGMPIAADKSATNSEEFICVDQRNGRAKIIICEGIDQTKNKNLAVLNIPVLADNRFGDEIIVEAELDTDIILTICAHSHMVYGYGKDEEYSVRKTAEVYQLQFGLDMCK